MHFETLPPEIQMEIFSYLEHSHLKAVRSVCRAFRDNAEPSLFRSVIMAARYQALGAFQKISLFQAFQKHVREIIFDGSLYDKMLTGNERFYHLVAARIPECEQGLQWQKHNRWKRYAQLYKEQEEMKSDGVLLHTLSKALEQMPNISCITYSPHPHHLPVEAKELKGLIPRSYAIMSRKGFTAPDHPFRQLIGAIYLSQFTGIRELRAAPVHEDVRNGCTEFALGIFDLDDDEMAAARFVFQGLEKLVLNMALDVADACSFAAVTHKFATLLRDAANLQYLHFSLTYYSDIVSLPFLCARLGLQTCWPRLQTLSLEGVSAKENELTDMIKRHHTTLKSVRFSQCTLVEGTWANIVDEVVYGSHIYPFVLCGVDEESLPYHDLDSLSTAERKVWSYEGHVNVDKHGERLFVENNPAKKSVYESRNRPTDAKYGS